MSYTTIIQVLSTRESALLRAISKVEPRLAKSTGNHAKLVEKSGKALSKFFSKNVSTGKCERLDPYHALIQR